MARRCFIVLVGSLFDPVGHPNLSGKRQIVSFAFSGHLSRLTGLCLLEVHLPEQKLMSFESAYNGTHNYSANRARAAGASDCRLQLPPSAFTCP